MMISVASGKGGTGKTLVATSLAKALSNKISVQLLDCDVEEPNCHILLKPHIDSVNPVSLMVPAVDDNKCTYCNICSEVCAFHAIVVLARQVIVFPHLCHSCGACSYFCPQKCISKEAHRIGVVKLGRTNGIQVTQGQLDIGEAMPVPVIRDVKRHAVENTVVIIDVCPGTACPVVEALRNTDFCLLVSEPTPFGLNDLKLAVDTVQSLGVKCGLVLNRAGTSDDNIESYCRDKGIPIMMRIPLDIEIARLYSRGITLVEGMPWWKDEFIRLYERIKGLVN